jgi:hypothetical protein
VVTVHILDTNVMRFRHHPLLGVGIFYIAIRFQMLNRYWAVKWLTVVQEPFLKCIEYTVHEYILIISEHGSSSFMSPVAFNLYHE